MEADEDFASLMYAEPALRSFLTEVATLNEERDAIYRIKDGGTTTLGPMNSKLRKEMLDEITAHRNEVYDMYWSMLQDSFPNLTKGK